MQIIKKKVKKDASGVLFFILFTLICAPQLSQAKEKEDAGKSKWALSLGIGWLHDYPAAGQGRVRLLPIPIYRGTFFRMDRVNGVSGQVYKNTGLQLAWSFVFNFPTASSDIPIRASMPDLDWLLSAGPQVRQVIWFNDKHTLFFRFPIRFNACTNFSDRTRWCGLTFNPGFRHKMDLEKAGNITLRLEAFAHSSEHQKYYYEVEPQYARPNRPAYHAKAGFLGYVLGAFYTLPFEGWDLSMVVNLYDYGQSVNRESPLAQNDFNYMFFTAFTIEL